MRTAVLIPCHNERASVAKVVADYRRLLPDAVIYVYDNNSSDGTAEAAAAAGAVVVPEYRQGKGFVVRSMFRDIDADVYLMVDGDDTYEAKDVAALVDPIVDGRADMVVGNRLAGGYLEKNTRPLHGFGNRLVRWMINRIFRARLADIMSGARAFSRSFVRGYPVTSGGFEVETEMTIHALDKRFLIAESPVAYRERGEGSVSKLSTVRDGLRVLKTIIALFKDFRPLLFSALVAMALFLGALALFIAPLEEYIATGFVRKIPSLIVAMALGTSALLSLVTGTILDSIRKQSRMLYELELTAQRARCAPGLHAGVDREGRQRP